MASPSRSKMEKRQSHSDKLHDDSVFIQGLGGLPASSWREMAVDLHSRRSSSVGRRWEGSERSTACSEPVASSNPGYSLSPVGHRYSSSSSSIQRCTSHCQTRVSIQVFGRSKQPLTLNTASHARRLDIWRLDTSNPACTCQLATYSLFPGGKSTKQLSLYQDLVAFCCEGRAIAVFDWTQSRQDNYVAVVLQLSERYMEYSDPVSLLLLFF